MTTNSELFAIYATRLDKFASEHNLRVEKYRYDMPMWSFLFHHSLGGHGKVDFGINDKKNVWITKYWTVDDYDALTRKAKSTPSQVSHNAKENLEEVLLGAIKDILSWKPEELDRMGGIASGPWCDPDKRPVYPKVKL